MTDEKQLHQVKIILALQIAALFIILCGGLFVNIPKYRTL